MVSRVNRNRLGYVGTSAAAWALACGAARAQCPGWMDIGQMLPGVAGTVYAAYSWDPDGAGPQPALLVVGGTFAIAGNEAVSNIAAWDGVRWRGVGEGFAGTVRSLGSYRGELIAGGMLERSGETLVSGIARFDGSRWNPMGEGAPAGTTPTVQAMIEWNGLLYAGGTFTGGTLAMWDGQTWTPYSSTISFPPKKFVELSGELFANWSLARVLRNGVWVNTGLAGTPGAFATHDDSLWAFVNDHSHGGSFSTGYDWDAPVGPWSWFSRQCPAWTSDAVSFGGRLFVGSEWDPYSEYPGYVTEMSGTGPIGPRFVSDRSVKTVIRHGDHMIAGGDFTAFNYHGAGGLASYDGTAWSKLGTGLGTTPLAIAMHGGVLHAVTTALIVHTEPVVISKYENGSWIPLEVPGLSSVYVEALASAEGRLYVTGQFAISPNYFSMASTDGVTWRGEEYPAGLSGLTSFAGELYAGGDGVFRRIGGVWTRIATTDGPVYALHDAGDRLIVGGDFTMLNGNPAPRLAEWDGASWTAIDNPYEAAARNIASYGQDLYFATTTALHARTGGEWRVIAVHGLTPSMVATSAGLYTAGSFASIEGKPAQNIAFFDGTRWNALGDGLDRRATVLAAADGGVYVGGQFLRASGIISPNWAFWSEGRDSCPADVNCDGGVDGADVEQFWSWFEAGDDRADRNMDGGVDGADVEAFYVSWESGC